MINPWAIVIFVVFNAIGLFLLVKAQGVRNKANRATKWPTTTGTVLESDLKEDPSRNALGNVNVGYLLLVKYEYAVSGRNYAGERVSFGTPAFNYITGSNLLDSYQSGKTVPVYYNSDHPEECVLAPKNTIGMFSRIPGIFMIVTGCVVGFLSLAK
jgi:hypothetical protein